MFKKFKWAWGLLLLTLITGVMTLLQFGADAQIPTHWNAMGEVDGWSSPTFAFLLMPGVQFLMILIFALLPKLEPRQENISKSSKAIQAIVVGTVGLMAVVQAAIIAGAYGHEPMGPKTIIAGVGIMLSVIGNYMTKLRSNFFIGIRTPWTLSSDTVWKKTHRLGARLFVIAGAIIFAGSFFVETAYLSGLLLAVILPTTAYIVYYSWRIWQEEQAET
ncbi:MAG: SdpI family protein [Alphaproteobacteria bacterium]|nr:SdpI family protein [Alphaproteobacteria bacterium]